MITAEEWARLRAEGDEEFEEWHRAGEVRVMTQAEFEEFCARARATPPPPSLPLGNPEVLRALVHRAIVDFDGPGGDDLREAWWEAYRQIPAWPELHGEDCGEVE